MSVQRSQRRDELVAQARSLVDAVALTAIDDELMVEVQQALFAAEVRLRSAALPSVPRTQLAEAVGATSYSWQWANPGYPEVSMTFDGTEVIAAFDDGLGAVHEGPPGILHGGVAVMLLDAVISSLVQFHGIPALTASLITKFRAPTPINAPFYVRARLGRITDRRVHASGAIVVDGVDAVRAEGSFAPVDSWTGLKPATTNGHLP